MAIQVLNGLSIAMFLALVAVGISLIFGIARVVNLAHGSFYMLGAYFMVSLSELKPGHLWFWISIVLSAVSVGIFSFFIEYFLLRQIYKRGPHLQLILTFGITLIVSTLVILVWGSEYKRMTRPTELSDMITLMNLPFPMYNLIIMGLVPVIMIGLWAILKFTRWGIDVRAASVDRIMLEAVGCNVNALLTQVFVLSGFLAGLAGALSAPVVSVDLSMGTEVLLNSFVVVIIGGLGSIAGGLIGALIVGQLQSFGMLVFPEISSVLIYVVMFLVLVIRPMGLLGKSEGRIEDEGVGV